MTADPTGLILALDTSSQMIGYAIADETSVLAEAVWRGQRQGTTMLLAEVVRALELLGLSQDDLRAVAVAMGPGSFSGLRVGIGIAKGLALGLGIPIIGVPTLAFTAEPFRATGQPICATVAAGRGRYAFAVFTKQDGELIEAAPTMNGTADDIAATLATYPAAIICGELDTEAEAILRSVPGAIVPPAGVRTRRLGALADVARRRILRGDTDDLVALEPIYIHTSPAPRGMGPERIRGVALRD